MLVLRVRCLDDGRELLFERHGTNGYSIQVAELKKLVLQHRQQVWLNNKGVKTRRNSQFSLEDCFILHRGEIRADSDVIDLNAWTPSDFFVFASDATSSTINAMATACVTQASSIGPRRSLVLDENLRRLQQVVAMDSLEAVVHLKEHFSSDSLHQLHQDPVTTLQLLALPTPAASMAVVETKTYSERDTDTELEKRVETEAFNNSSRDAVNRLVAMGFARDLVEVLYESCGGDEQLTANALLETSES
ncbi:unnamed protein product [Peronospora belbahrii]|uniref:UBA domain-containing protein n=1 Tax=Peronospora belbahrii TaxID=622444 RepID=A0AAU9KUR1_9STRA|nr:unnamed protein product [Peronospora belbahrii]CAH0514737.1 unnamed protein product [Peronospora belbahrii]